jgi:hypothetical protein
MKTVAATFALVGASVFALAQVPGQPVDPLGRVTEARGVVTVSDGATVGLAEKGTPFFDGTRFVSSPSGNAELTLDNGCVVRLKPNESIVIRDKINCEELLALVQGVPGAPVVAGAGGSNLGVYAAVGAVLLLASNGGGSGGSSNNGGGGGVIPVPPISGQ